MDDNSVDLSQELEFVMADSHRILSDDILYANVGYKRNRHPSVERYRDILNKNTVLEAIKRARELDAEVAREIAIALVNTVWYVDGGERLDIDDAVELVARMSNLGYIRSREAVAKAMVPYVLSRSGLEDDKMLERNAYLMSDAIEEEQPPRRTIELGLVQALRLWKLRRLNSGNGLESVSAPDVNGYIEHFRGFPTIGAEFHILEDDRTLLPNFWERVAVLNMSQYQRGSFIPFSRNDKGVIEIRMNPSVYPVSIANRNLMKAIVPELAEHYFSLCIGGERNFEHQEDDLASEEILLLQTLGSITYASYARNTRKVERREDTDFGNWHLSQTVKLNGEGRYGLEGTWGRNHGQRGQLNLFSGFGDSFPYQSYWISMAAGDYELLSYFARFVDKYAKRGMTPQEAVQMKEEDTAYILQEMSKKIVETPRLRRATEYGQRIMQALSV